MRPNPDHEICAAHNPLLHYLSELPVTGVARKLFVAAFLIQAEQKPQQQAMAIRNTDSLQMKFRLYIASIQQTCSQL